MCTNTQIIIRYTSRFVFLLNYDDLVRPSSIAVLPFVYVPEINPVGLGAIRENDTHVIYRSSVGTPPQPNRSHIYPLNVLTKQCNISYNSLWRRKMVNFYNCFFSLHNYILKKYSCFIYGF